MKNHANPGNVPIAPRYRGKRELMHKKSIPFHGLLCQRNAKGMDFYELQNNKGLAAALP